MEKVLYKDVLTMAVKSANAAGKTWTGDPSPSSCLSIYIKIVNPNTSFARWIRAHQSKPDRVTIAHSYRQRSERGLLETCERAALQILLDHKITGIELCI